VILDRLQPEAVGLPFLGHRLGIDQVNLARAVVPAEVGNPGDGAPRVIRAVNGHEYVPHLSFLNR
jgi:hypothetical protein